MRLDNECPEHGAPYLLATVEIYVAHGREAEALRRARAVLADVASSLNAGGGVDAKVRLLRGKPPVS
jgi:hypothetical protein